MITVEELRKMAELDIRDIDIDDVKDIRDINIDINLPKEERVKQYIEQTGNPYFVKCGDIIVKLSFTDKEPLEQIIKRCVRQEANIMV